MSKGKGKKLVYVSESLVDEISKISRARDTHVGKFVEDALRQAVTMTRDGQDLAQVVDFYNVMRAHRVLGGAFIPSSILDFMVENLWKEKQEQLLECFYESGKWYGTYLKDKYAEPVEALEPFLKLTRWELNDVEVKDWGNNVKVRCVSTVLTNEGTLLLSRFLEGLMHALGYKTEKVDCLKGLIILESKK
jgi:hypothetical protein